MWAAFYVFAITSQANWQSSILMYLALSVTTMYVIKWWIQFKSEVTFSNETAQAFAFPEGPTIRKWVLRYRLTVMLVWWFPVTLVFIFARKTWLDEAGLIGAVFLLFISHSFLFDFICQEYHDSGNTTDVI